MQLHRDATISKDNLIKVLKKRDELQTTILGNNAFLITDIQKKKKKKKKINK